MTLKNGNPGALAGATGAEIKARQLSSVVYTATPDQASALRAGLQEATAVAFLLAVQIEDETICRDDLVQSLWALAGSLSDLAEKADAP